MAGGLAFCDALNGELNRGRGDVGFRPEADDESSGVVWFGEQAPGHALETRQGAPRLSTPRIFANCLLAAALAAGAFWLTKQIDAFLLVRGWDVVGFSREYFGGTLVGVWLYDVGRYALCGVAAAASMLLLTPRRKLLYALASTAPMAWYLMTAIVWSTVLSQAPVFYLSLLLTWLLTIPLIYLAFCRFTDSGSNEQRHQKVDYSGASSPM